MRQRRATIVKRFTFEAAHSLPGHQGKCARLHGHSYRLEVAVQGPIKVTPGATDDGMVMDFSDLSQAARAVLSRLDHQNLNDVTCIRTTAENLSHWIWEALVEGGLPEQMLAYIRLWETETGYVEITSADRGEKP